jgi:hypothetical protein
VELLSRSQGSSSVVMVVSRRIWSLDFEPMGSSFHEDFRRWSPVGSLSERMVTTGPAAGAFCAMGSGAAKDGL